MNKILTMLHILAVLASGMLCTGCSNEDIAAETPNTKGVLRLLMSSEQVFISTQSRATQSLNDFSSFKFTLKKGSESRTVTFTEGSLSLEAGEYTLSATNSDAADAGYSAPLYSGSVDFSISAAEQKTVTLNLGKPKNAMVTVTLSDDFSAKYDLHSMTLTDGSKSSTLTSSKTTTYFPATATTLNYTLVANAKAGSHVQDITSATGTITISAGTHTPVTLKLNPIDSNLIEIETGSSHSGEFE